MIANLVQTIISNKASKKLGDLSALNNNLRKYNLVALDNLTDKKLIGRMNGIINSATNAEYQNDRLIKVISKQVSQPKYRAFQSTYRYRQLHIFKSFSKIIDLAIIAFLRGNFACSYLTLLQVTQEILRKWLISMNEEENPQILLDKIKEKIVFTKEDLDAIKNGQEPSQKRLKIEPVIKTSDGECLNHLKYLTGLYKYLAFMIKNLYDKEGLPTNILCNRHIKDHLNKKPEYFCNSNNSLALIALLDVISELYLWKNQYDYLMLTSDIDSKFNHRLYKKYQRFFKNNLHPLNPKSKSPEEILLKRFY